VKMKRIAPFLILGLVLPAMLSCGSRQSSATIELVKVTRGDLTVTVSGSGNLNVLNDAKLTFSAAGRIDKIYVHEGDRVSTGDKIASLVTDSLELAVSQAQVSYAQSQAAVTQAEVVQKTAERNLNQALGSFDMSQVDAAQADVDQATAYLQNVTTNMAQASPLQQANWATTFAYAQARLAAAEARLNAIVGNNDTDEVSIARLQVQSAAQSTDLARQSVTLAQKTLEQTEKQLNDATLVAPFPGIVGSLNVKEGDNISPALVIAEIVDPSGMYLQIQTDEIDVVNVSLGQRAIISVDAEPSLKIDGKVTLISVVPSSASGVVVYNTKLSFAAPEDSKLRTGMSASADIVTTERKSVLLVPDRAIGTNKAGQNVVTLLVNGKNEERVITPGVSDGVQTEVLKGLQEGDTVVVRTASQSASGLF